MRNIQTISDLVRIYDFVKRLMDNVEVESEDDSADKTFEKKKKRKLKN